MKPRATATLDVSVHVETVVRESDSRTCFIVWATDAKGNLLSIGVAEASEEGQ